ncbi:hypothetical protein HY627_01195 [Candidatus Uhrbacteria bacterium]|nr:hypothetical protein [Candidatus Uhrbacteria bacterium]
MLFSLAGYGNYAFRRLEKNWRIHLPGVAIKQTLAVRSALGYQAFGLCLAAARPIPEC